MEADYLTDIERLEGLSPEERGRLKEVSETFAFRANNYYLSLIDWNDPDDPIRRLIIPAGEELHDWGQLDPSEEQRYTVMPGVQHKYRSTVLFLVCNMCGGICRYCFRKRIFMREETLRDLDAALAYVMNHREVTNVLLTGGDPLMLETSKIEKIIRRLREVDHVGIIRIGTRMPVFNPYRILDDPAFLNVLKKYSTRERRIYIITHFDHPRELTDVAVDAIYHMHRAGAVLANQTPLIRGVNDNPEVLAELFRKLSFAGIAPYYVFQCRPSSGNREYAVPMEEGYDIFEHAKSLVSGIAKRARLVMSHATGKLEIIGKSEKHLYLKYHRAARDENSGKIITLERNPEGYWLEDYYVLPASLSS